MSKRKQRIGFRIVGADATSGDIMWFDAEALHDASLAIFGERFDLDQSFRRDAARLHIRFIHEGDHSPTEHASVAVIETVNCRVVLVVTAQCRQPKHFRVSDRGIFAETVEYQKICASRRRVPNSLARWNRKMETTRVADAFVEIGSRSRTLASHERSRVVAKKQLHRNVLAIALANKLSAHRMGCRRRRSR